MNTVAIPSQRVRTSKTTVTAHSVVTRGASSVHARTDYSNAGGDTRPDRVVGVSTDPPKRMFSLYPVTGRK